jgi:hypothetical protein
MKPYFLFTICSCDTGVEIDLSPENAVNNPPKTPVMNAIKALKTAKGHPIMAPVISMESTPVCGVEIKNDTVDAFEAPDLKNDIPVGITPHEHKGKGTPMAEALKLDHKDEPPKCFWAKLRGIKICKTPANRNPNKR